MINMRGGDIFMGAFNAEQVMYNHFGYRSPIPNLYNAGSAGHPGGAISGGSCYISARAIAASSRGGRRGMPAYRLSLCLGWSEAPHDSGFASSQCLSQTTSCFPV